LLQAQTILEGNFLKYGFEAFNLLFAAVSKNWVSGDFSRLVLLLGKKVANKCAIWDLNSIHALYLATLDACKLLIGTLHLVVVLDYYIDVTALDGYSATETQNIVNF